MKRLHKTWLLPLAAMVLLLLTVAWLAGIFHEKIPPGLGALATTPSDNVSVVTTSRWPATESVPGTIRAKEAALISSRILARITRIHVRAGDIVNVGDVLIELERTDTQARVAQSREQVKAARARVDEAKRNLARAEKLHARGLVAIAEVDTARATYDALVADLGFAQKTAQEAEATLTYTTIRSPINGRIIDRFAEPGDTATPGNRLLSLYNPSAMRVEAHVRERLALDLEIGQALSADIPTLNKNVVAHVEERVPAADPGSRSFLVKSRIDVDAQLLPGMYAQLNVPAGEVERIMVPKDTIAQVGQLNVLWVQEENGQILRRFVRIGRQHTDGQVEVLSGLRDGEKVLLTHIAP